jgi:hypothetical protein
MYIFIEMHNYLLFSRSLLFFDMALLQSDSVHCLKENIFNVQHLCLPQQILKQLHYA